MNRIHLPMKMEQTQCSETSAIKHHTLENNPKGYTRHTEHGESLKSRIMYLSSLCKTEKTIFNGKAFRASNIAFKLRDLWSKKNGII
jgi:hypothetical protein